MAADSTPIIQKVLITRPPAATEATPSINFQTTLSEFGEEVLVNGAGTYNNTIDPELHWLFFEYGPEDNLSKSGLFVFLFYLCEIDNTQLSITSCTQHLLLDPYWYSQNYYFSPNEKYLAVTTPNTLWIFQLDPWQEVIVIRKAKSRSEVDWAPDGSGVLLQFEGGKYAAEFLTLDGVITPVLTREEVFPSGYQTEFGLTGTTYWGPVWSPDVKSVAYLRTLPTRQELWVKNLVTGETHPVFQDATHNLGTYPKWSPDGKKIAIVSNGLRVFDILSGSEKQLIQLSSDPMNPDSSSSYFSWSPDSKQIAIGYNDGDKMDGVYIVDIDTGSGRFVQDEGDDVLYWKPDGTIVFRSAWGKIGWIKLNDK